MKKLILILPFLASLLFGGLNYDSSIDTKELDKMSTQKILVSLEWELAHRLPMRLDEITTLVKVLGMNGEFAYYKQIDTNNAVVKDFFTTPTNKNKLKKVLFTQDSNIACTNSLFAYLTDKRDVVVVYKWVDKNFKPLFEYSVDKKDCAAKK